MNRIDAAVSELRAELAQALFLRWLVWLAGGWCFLFATGALLARVAGGSFPLGSIGVAGLPVAAAAALVLSRRRAPGADAIRAALDALTHAGGLLAASAEVDIGAWSAMLPSARGARVRWREPRALWLLALGCLYAATAMLVPVRPAAAARLAPVAIDEVVQALKQKVDVLVATELLETERARQLATQLDRLTDDTQTGEALKTWEALDHVADSIRGLAADVGADLARDISEATTLAALSQALQEAGLDAAAESKLADAMRELAGMVEASRLLDELTRGMSPELAQALKQLALDPARIEALKACLKKCQAGKIDKLGKLCEAGLIDPATLSACQTAAADGEAALAAFVDAQCENGALASLAAACQQPGQGGVTRGRGDAPLTWTDGTDENGAAFKEQVLPPAALGPLDNSRLIGLSRGAPEVDGTPQAVQGGRLGAGGEGGGAHKQQVLPRHRRAVERFFHRGAK